MVQIAVAKVGHIRECGYGLKTGSKQTRIVECKMGFKGVEVILLALFRRMAHELARSFLYGILMTQGM